MCGIVGIFNVSESSKYAALGLHSLQHRGQEGAGIVSYSDKFHRYNDYGRVHDIFGNDEIINSLPGYMSIGHVRYSTTGGSSEENVQPLYCTLDFGEFVIAHNGNLTDSETVRSELIKSGAIFQTTTDTENIPHLLAQNNINEHPLGRFMNTLNNLKGAFSIIAFIDGKMVVARDPNGYRPLSIGKFETGYVAASETCALDIIGASDIIEVEPGEIVIFEFDMFLNAYKHHLKSDKFSNFKLKSDVQKRFCIFEHIYFSRPDSILDGNLVYSTRKEIGKQLALESFIDCDMVIPVPDSGVPSALGYSEKSGVPFEMAITRSHYRGRTFIQPTQHIRNLGVKLKHSAMSLVKGKNITIVDDSIVRGTTSKKIVSMCRDAGAKEIHMRIASPPVIGSCYYGIDTPTRQELVASSYTTEEIRKYINADTLSYLSVEGLYSAVNNGNREGYCDACFTGNYPKGDGF